MTGKPFKNSLAPSSTSIGKERPERGSRLIVIGGGAAGFFCAVNAARLNPDLNVVLLEKTGKLLSKVRISGGGRCNVTHACYDITEMSTRYPRGKNFVKKAFHKFFTKDTISWFEDRGVQLKTEKDGRMFPISDDSDTIIRCLLTEANRYRVEIKLNLEVKKIERNEGNFLIDLSNGKSEAADFICIATGGYPKATMFNWLKSLGHSILEPVPSLFTFNLPKHPISKLMGVSVEDVRVKIEGSKLVEHGPILVTHWGLSGPVILRLSAWGARELAKKNYQFKVHINWCAGISEKLIRTNLKTLRSSCASKKVANQNFSKLPNRLWIFLLEQSGITSTTRFGDLTSKSENNLVKNLLDYTLEVRGKTTFKEEFVTAGGINLTEIDPDTMMSKKLKNLFFAGEVLDVDGITGGFNFQHAWTSGWIAASSIKSNI